jgi:glycosyltransferase involved in cell wall biosynthesis
VKIFIAIPTFDGKLQHQVVGSLLVEQSIAHRLGDEFVTCLLPHCSNLPVGRDQLVSEFLASGCERMFFLDSDITWEPGALIKLAHRPEDFVAGCTRYKNDEEAYPIGWLPNEFLYANAQGLLEIKMIGTAFMSLSRNVFKIIKEFAPGREYETWGETYNCFFEQPFLDGQVYGEDAYFCKSWRDAGGKIFLDPEIEITHWKFDRPFVGHIGKWLRARMENQHEQGRSEKTISSPLALPQGPQAEAPRIAGGV